MPKDTWATRKRAEEEAMGWADASVENKAAARATAANDPGATRMARDEAIGHRETQRGLRGRGFTDAEIKKLQRDAGAYDK
jgi:hypothetical protein